MEMKTMDTAGTMDTIGTMDTVNNSEPLATASVSPVNPDMSESNNRENREKNNLRYTRMNHSDNVITIDLHNGYRVMAVSGWQPDRKIYITTLLLSDSTIDNWVLIEDAECIEFIADYKTINSTILRYVSQCLRKGFFDYYIKRYQFMVSCIDSFYNLLEMENALNVK